MLPPRRGTFTLLFLLRVAASTRAATWLAAGLMLGSVRTAAADVEVIWKSQLPGDETAMSIALDEAGRFYTATSKRRVLCFSASGELAWQALTPADIQTAPVIDNDGRVFVAYNGGFPSFEHTTLPLGRAIAAWNPDGTHAWTLDDFTSLPPAVAANGDILISNSQSYLRRWSAEGLKRWEVNNSVRIGAPSLRGDDRAYVAATWSVDKEGTTVWSHPGPEGGTTAAIGRDGTLYFGTSDQSVFFPPPPGSFLAVGTDGVVRWEYPSGSIASSPAILPDDSLVVGTLAGTILRLSSAGQRIWEFDAGAPVESSPAVTADGVIWCGSNDGRFHALNNDGTVRWQWKLGTAVRSSPAIGPDGRVYIAADGGGIFVFQGGAPPADSPWPMHRHDAHRTGRNTVTPSPPGTPGDLKALEGDERGAIALTWSSSPWAETYEVWRGTTDVAEDMVRIADSLSGQNAWTDRDAEHGRTYHYRVRARNGLGFSPFSPPSFGSQTSRLWQVHFPSPIAAGPALAPDGSLRLTFFDTTHGLVALNPDGSIRWQAPIKNPLRGLVVGPDGTTYLGIWPSEVVAVGPSGEIRWRSTLDGTLSPGDDSNFTTPPAFAWTPDGLLLVHSDPTGLQAFDADGASRTLVGLSGGGALAPVVTSDGSVFLTTRTLGGVTVLDRYGQRLWQASDLRLTTAAVAPDGSFVGADATQIVSLSPTGRLNWLVPMVSFAGIQGPPVIAPDGSVYVADGRRLHALNADGSSRWAADAPDAYHPLLLDDGTIIVRRHQLLEARGANGSVSWFAFVGLSAEPAVVDTAGAIYAVGFSNLCKFAGHHGPPTTGWPMGRLNAARTAGLARTTTDPAPAPVRNPSATTGQRVGHVQVHWDSDPQFAWVEIWRSPGTDPASATRIGRALPGAFAYQDHNALPGRQYHYWLRATNTAGATPLVGPVEGFATPDTQLLWIYQPAGEFALSTVARGDNGHLYTCTGSGKLMAITRAGQPAWSFTELQPPLSDPVVGTDGTVFIYSYDQLAAVHPDGTLRWKRPIRVGTGVPALARDGGVVLVQWPMLTAYDPAGAARWSSALPATQLSSPAIGLDGKVHLLGGDGLLTFQGNDGLATQRELEANVWRTLATTGTGSLYLTGYPKALARLEPTGVPRFAVLDGERNLPREPCVAPDGSAFLLTSNGKVTAVDADGRMKWEYPAPAAAMVADATGGVVVATSNLVIALDAGGAERWSYTFKIPQPATAVPTPPLLTPNGLLAFTSGNRVLVLQTTLAPAPSGWPMHRANPARDGRASLKLSIANFQATPAGGWELSVSGVQGTTCLVEESADLTTWSIVTRVSIRIPNLTIPLPSHPGPGPRFYRVKTE